MTQTLNQTIRANLITERELELRRTIAEMQAQVDAEHVPIDKPEVYSPHTLIIGGAE